jgi:hypothetical protein
MRSMALSELTDARPRELSSGEFDLHPQDLFI